MRYTTVVKRFAVVDGRRYDRVAGSLATEPTSRFAKGRGRGNLYALIEMRGAPSSLDTLAERMAKIINESYYRQRRSVTAGLREAIREANSFLLHENENSMAGDQGSAGISCAVLRGEDLYIAQAGPAALYVGGKGQVKRFPEVSPWLDSSGSWSDTDATPVGKGPDLHVDLFHATVSRNDTLLFVSPGLARRLPPRAWGNILAAASVDAVIGELLAVGAGGDWSALAIRLGEDRAGEQVAQAPVAVAALAPEVSPAPSPQPAPPKKDVLQIKRRMGARREEARAIRKSLRRQARAQKALALTSIATNTAAGIVRTIALMGAPVPPNNPAIAGVAAVAASGAVQAARIASERLPTFAHGGAVTPGGPDHRAVSVSPREAILNERATQRLGSQGINALNHDQALAPQVTVVQTLDRRVIASAMADTIPAAVARELDAQQGLMPGQRTVYRRD